MLWSQRFAIYGLVIAALCGCDQFKNHPNKGTVHADSEVGTGKDAPVSLVGEKFFREARFSQYFYAHSTGDYNKLPAQGDSVVAEIEVLDHMGKNPYKGQAISCAACHFVDQAADIAGFGTRAYSDFSRRSRVPDRGDGLDRTVRNSPNMVSMARENGFFLHSDGEFATAEDLIRATYLGRNMGWLANEGENARHHIAEVVRHDSGRYPTDTDLVNLNYKDILAGAATVPAPFRIPPEYRIDIEGATDEQIFSAVIRLVGQYIRALDYSRDEKGFYNGSPYDAFLRKNNLPLAPGASESAAAYSQRLIQLVNKLQDPQIVDSADGKFQVQQQDFVFAAEEIDGMKTFFGAGQCASCHVAPDFTDHLFHNTGVSQFEYDQVHGDGQFMNLTVPDLAARNSNPNLYLPASENFPQAQALFRSFPDLSDPQRADLGVWAVFLNPSIQTPQATLRPVICRSLELDCAAESDASLLDATLGMIKTPSTRDLGQSAPYFHSGHADSVTDVVTYYATYSALARAGRVRNADPRLKNVHLEGASLENLVRFLKALNEDYN